MSAKSFVPTKNASTWEVISNRLAKFVPPIDLAGYIDPSKDKILEVCEYSSQGIWFSVSRGERNRLVKALRGAKTESGKQAFQEGKWQGAKHAGADAADDLKSSLSGDTSKEPWALDISMAATKGIGFRQIWYLELSEHQWRLKDALGIQEKQAYRIETPPMFDSKFGAGQTSIDLSSLHWEIGDPDKDTDLSKCNIHIDQVGIYASLGSGGSVTPDALYHSFVELAFRTGLHGYLPDSVLQAIEFVMPASANNYAAVFGIQGNFIDRGDLRLSLRAGCYLQSESCTWFATLNLSGTMNLWGSK